ncbi:hypothetical protein FQN54_009876 [Arachnomyces sp. PD_36]|nr:hypothetical protein FQN54_009876 [Arachnomyces sp. PD_36]
MHSASLLWSLTASISLFSQFTSTTAETVLGAYIYSRHGDRTSKSTPPTVLTTLGYSQVFTSGDYYRNRYISSDSSSSSQIAGIAADIVDLSQIVVSSPLDNVLQNSATGFLQGLYPPVSSVKQTLRNNTVIDAPMNGYQLIPVDQIETGSNSEDSAWLQSTSSCPNAEVSSNNYFNSPEYEALLDSTADFYKSLTPMLEPTFEPSEISYKNAYTIFDYLNVASIQNVSADLDALTPEVSHQLLTLANAHEFGLAYNSSDTVGAITGAVLAGEVVTALKEVISSKGEMKLNIQFGAYATFQSFFGLSQLTSANPDFYGIPDYASTMAWELITDSTSDDFPSESEISVRFLFKNGTASADSAPTAFPLFGQSETVIPWTDFVSKMDDFAISSQEKWCEACGNTTGSCASGDVSTSSPAGGIGSGSSGSGGISTVIAGVIGALVTLGVVLGLEALVLLVGGFRLAKKQRGASIGEKVDP